MGYKASPILWTSIKTGLSAGRVQTVALRLIVEREREIRAFKPQEYWTIEALCAKDGQTFEASARQGRRPEAAAPLGRGGAGRGGRGAAAAVRRHQGREAPAPEESGGAVHHQHAAAGSGQEARLQLPAHHARGAGSLRGHGRRRGRPVGLITYMRTDSARVSETAIASVRDFIGKQLRASPTCPTRPTSTARARTRGCQDAHEAIRPTDVAPAPRAGAAVPRARPVPALPADLAALRGVADDAGGLRHDHRRLRPGPVSVPGHRLGARVRRLPRALHRGPGEGGREDDGRPPAHPAARAGRPGRGPGDHAVAALHRAAAALLRGQPGEGARAARHRPAVHLQRHHLDPAARAST